MQEVIGRNLDTSTMRLPFMPQIQYLAFLLMPAICNADIIELPDIEVPNNLRFVEDNVPNPPKTKPPLEHHLDMAFRDNSLKEFEKELVKLIQKVRVSCVYLTTNINSTKVGSDRIRSTDEKGAGVIIEENEKKYVLTNWHVVSGAKNPDAVEIELDNGSKIKCTGLWKANRADVAICELDSNSGVYGGLVAAEIGDSATVNVGDIVLAVGNPFGKPRSFSCGNISGDGRNNLQAAPGADIQDFFQVTAALNPGNSGGPLFNLDGKLVAVNTAISSNSGKNEGVGYSLTGNLAMEVAKMLVKTKGNIVYGELGIEVRELSDSEKEKVSLVGYSNSTGVAVNSLTLGSIADKAGLRAGDIILSFRNEEVNSPQKFERLESFAYDSGVYPMKVLSKKEVKDLTVIMANTTK